MTKYDTFGQRFWAGVLDDLVVIVPLGIVHTFMPAPDRSVAVAMTWTIVSWLMARSYSVILHARYGQTLGKMLAGVRVLDLSEQRVPGLKQALLRDLGANGIAISAVGYQLFLMAAGRYARNQVGPGGRMIVIMSLGWFLLDCITMMTNSRRRAVHDYLAGTVVVRLDDPRLKLSRLES
jgi:uncharacterized RDD family membrane protein YckC